jgi:hypothetical protein
MIPPTRCRSFPRRRPRVGPRPGRQRRGNGSSPHWTVKGRPCSIGAVCPRGEARGGGSRTPRFRDPRRSRHNLAPTVGATLPNRVATWHKGQLLLRQGQSEDAEDFYRKALSIAREQEAKLWELRAATSLARLRLYQGRHAEGRALLAPVYGWFTEGFDTPDLREAKALLDELT